MEPKSQVVGIGEGCNDEENVGVFCAGLEWVNPLSAIEIELKYAAVSVRNTLTAAAPLRSTPSNPAKNLTVNAYKRSDATHHIRG